jgi:hypothetical protein
MPALDPGDQSPKQLVVYIGEGLLRHDVSEIISPAPQLAVELPDQVFRFGRDVGFDDSANSFEEAFDRTLGGLDEELACVLAYVESKKIKAVVVNRRATMTIDRRPRLTTPQ